MIYNSTFKNRTNNFVFLLPTILLLSTVVSATVKPGHYSDLRGAGIGFTENKGQIADHEGNLRPDVLFTGDGGGTSLFIRNNGISYVLTKSDEMPEEAFQDPKYLEGLNYYSHRVDLDFVGCNAHAQVIKSDQVEGYKNFYLPHCSNGITHVNSYNTLLQKNIYNNIDIAYKGSKAEGLKYDFIVNPGGKVSDIVLRYSGQDALKIEDGNITLTTSLGQLNEFMPKVYQEVNGKIKDIKAKYKLNSDNNIVIEVGSYNKSLPLIIDPWVTYFGGSQMEFAYSITADAASNITFVGWVQSNNLPILGAFQGALSGTYDSFVSKMTAAGTLVWSTYYGGSNTEYAYGVHADPATNEIYFCGYTSSNNYPMGAAGGQTSFNSTYPGVNCATLVKFTPGGTRLWSTFYGGNPGYTVAYDVTTDAGGNAILVGYTSSTTDISTPGSFQPNLAGGSSMDVYVVKFAPTGGRTWASYLGGTSSESYGSVSCDASSNIYVSGITNSDDFPTTAGSHQPAKAGSGDAFLFKFNSSGSRVWGTYYGGTQYEYAYDVKVDNVGDVYIGGGTMSTSGISTAGSYQVAKAAGTSMDGYIAKFNSAGAIQWATYMGGSAGIAADYVTGLAIDVNNNVVVGGDTYSTNFPVSSCAYQSVFLGTEDQWIATFAPNGNIICSGYIGVGNSTSPNNETLMGGGSIAVSGGFIYLVAFTQCNYPVTAGCYQPVCGGNFDAAVAKLCITSCGLTNIIASFDADRTILCDKGDPANFALQNTSCSLANTKYLWTFDGGTPSTSTDQSPGNVVYNTAGVFPVKVVIETPCGKDSIVKAAYISVDNSDPTAAFTATPQPASMASPTISFIDQSTNGAVQWSWDFGAGGGTSTTQHPSFTYTDSGTYVVRLIVYNQYGCTDTIESTIIISGAEYAFYTPNSFTPNGDGLNDIFIPKNAGIDLNGEGYELLIYDRWGDLLFKTNNPTAGWDGKIKGTLGQIDTYVWKIKVKNIFAEEFEYVGHVNLLR